MKKILLFVLVLILPIQATAYLYDDFSDGYLDPELWEEVVADNSTNHIEYHFENQEENAYHTEKISILEAIGVEGHGRTLNKLWGYGQNGKWGWKIQTNTQFKLKKIIKSEAGDPSFAYIYSADRTQLAKTAFNGREALFDYQLEADTVYYIVADRLGGSYTRSYVDTDVNFPYVSPSFNIIKTAEINTGDERTDQIINIESLEIDSPTMYNRKGTRLSLTQPLQPGDKLEYEFALNSADGDHQSHLVFNNLTLFRRMHEIDNFTCGGFAGCGFFGEWNGANLWGKETGNYSISIDFNEDSADINIIKPSEETIYYKTRNLQPPFTFGIETRASADGLIHADYDNFYINSQPPEQEANLTVTLTPHQTIVPLDGSISYTFNITNLGNQREIVDVWSVLTPTETNILKGEDLRLYPGFSLIRSYSHKVPCSFPIGNYTYTVYVGDFNQTVLVEDSFNFEVVPPQKRFDSFFQTIIKQVKK